jgi:hypothetical protein
MVLDTQPFRNGGDGGAAAFRQPFDREKKLMLIRFQSKGTGRALTELQELTDLITKFRQGLKIDEREL